MELTPRKERILSSVVAGYIKSGEPVGSKAIADEVGVSSATVRNEMAGLIELGLLEQPHTSAGRIPSQKGYREYVDHLMKVPELKEEERRAFDSMLLSGSYDPEKLLGRASRLLSGVTRCVGIATTPENANLSVAHFKIMKAGRYNIAVIGITSAGGVKSRVCRIASEITDAELAEIEQLLNRGLVFVSGIDITKDYLEGLRAGADCYNAATAPIFEAARQTVVAAGEAQVFIKGSENLLNFRELNLKEALGFLANGNQIRNLSRRVGDAVTAFIGDETGYVYSDTLSVLLARYRVGNGLSGSVGVVGPLRMDYEYLVPRLQCFCNVLSDALISA